MRINEKEFAKQLGIILARAKDDKGVSQNYIADEFPISRGTLVNWYNGKSAPNIPEILRYFEILGLAPTPYLMELFFPQRPSSLEQKEELREVLHGLVDMLPEDGLKSLIFILDGHHGSSPNSALQLFLAYLQLPLETRTLFANMVFNSYTLQAQMNNLSSPEEAQPNMEILKQAFHDGMDAAAQGGQGYVNHNFES